MKQKREAEDILVRAINNCKKLDIQNSHKGELFNIYIYKLINLDLDIKVTCLCRKSFVFGGFRLFSIRLNGVKIQKSRHLKKYFFKKVKNLSKYMKIEEQNTELEKINRTLSFVEQKLPEGEKGSLSIVKVNIGASEGNLSLLKHRIKGV